MLLCWRMQRSHYIISKKKINTKCVEFSANFMSNKTKTISFIRKKKKNPNRVYMAGCLWYKMCCLSLVSITYVYVCMQKEKNLLLQPKEKKWYFSWKRKEKESMHACVMCCLSLVGTTKLFIRQAYCCCYVSHIIVNEEEKLFTWKESMCMQYSGVYLLCVSSSLCIINENKSLLFVVVLSLLHHIKCETWFCMIYIVFLNF